MASKNQKGSAGWVGLGILLSRISGLIREGVLAYVFGASPHADVFRTALRGPNLLQNLLGEQTLSAAFIPIYSRRLAADRPEEAGRFAGAILGLLLALAGGLALLGIVFARPIVAILASGYLGDAARVASGELAVDRFPLAVQAVRIIFPMTGILVLSAWSLGVLNSHRRFFVSYCAPVLWNASIIAALVAASGLLIVGGVRPYESIGAITADRILIAGCFGALIGGGLQFLVQVPWVIKEIRGFRLSLSLKVAGVRESLAAFAPLIAARGAIQLSGYFDLWLSSFLVAGAQASLGWAQTLYLLPVSLFGMSVAAAELPGLSGSRGAASEPSVVARVERAVRQAAFFTIPTALGYLLVGYPIVGALFRRGSFNIEDNWLVYMVLCGYSIGLPAANTSRILVNVFYSRGETRVPARIAAARVAMSAIVGCALMLWLDRFPVQAVVDIEGASGALRMGAVGLSLAAGAASWMELWALRRALNRVLPTWDIPGQALRQMLFAAFLALLPAMGTLMLVRGWAVELQGLAVVATFGAAYFFVGYRLAIPEAANFWRILQGVVARNRKGE